MDRVRLKILGLSYSMLQSNAYALILSDEADHFRIPIVIGMQEAQSIALQLEHLTTQRPMTHDILKALTMHLNVVLEEVYIYRLEAGIFYSELKFVCGEEVIRIDSRTSDAIALALRFECPVYTTKEIMEKAGISVVREGKKEMEEMREDVIKTAEETIDDYTAEELKGLMEKAIAKEDYEAASRYRDMLKEKTSDHIE